MINIPKGTKDVLPAEAYKWHFVENTARRVAALYNLKEDPSETRNVISQYPEIVKTLKNRLLEIEKMINPDGSNTKGIITIEEAMAILERVGRRKWDKWSIIRKIVCWKYIL